MVKFQRHGFTSTRQLRRMNQWVSLRPNLVDMRDVSFSRGERCIFDNISLTVPLGKITAIMGPSGISKTTLLRLIGGRIYAG